VDERLAEIPDPDAEVAWTKAKNKSVPQRDGLVVGKRQACKPEAYVEACESIGQEVDEEVVDRLRDRHNPENYYRRHRVIYTPAELDEVERELATAVALVSLLDGHALYPIRAAGPRVCASCDFAGICSDPSPGAIEADFRRVPPKRDRIPTPDLEAA
jgi:CRISPR/Cas system-associated exonuclease Cas4 (RecB family)